MTSNAESDGPVVSVIVPTYNRADLVPRAINGVLDQSFRPFECIVVDDGSTDHTEDVLNEFQDPRLRVIRHERNKGGSAARNTGIRQALGEYVAFCDSDDVWPTDKLERQVNLLVSLPENYGLVYCWMDVHDDSTGEVIDQFQPSYRGNVLGEILDDSRTIGLASTLLVRKSVVRDVGLFDERLRSGEDGDFIRRICRSYKVDYVPELSVRYSVNHGANRVSRRSTEQDIREAIHGQKRKLEKFCSEYEQHPIQKARTVARLAYLHLLVRDVGGFMDCLLRFLRTAPLSLRKYRFLYEKFAEKLWSDKTF